MDRTRIGLLVAAVAFAQAGACSRKDKASALPAAAQPASTQRIEVRTTTVAASGEVVIPATGTLLSAQETLIMGEVPGKLLKLHAEEGDLVAAGDPLAELDTTDFRLGLRASEAQLKGAELTLATTRLEYDRIAKLKEEGAITQSMYDGMKLKLDLTANGLDQARVGLDLARRRLAQATVRAPYDAVIVNRLASVGTQVQVMPPTVIYRIQDAQNLRLKLRVPEGTLRHVAVGDPVTARVDAAGVDIEGQVDQVVSSVDPMSRTFEVVINVDNTQHDMKLKPGMFATVRIRHAAPEGTPVVARENTLPVPGKDDEVRVFLVDGGKARERFLKVHALDAGSLAVTDGIKGGEALVVSDLTGLRDGAAVNAKADVDAAADADAGAGAGAGDDASVGADR